MKLNLKRVWSGVAALTVAASSTLVLTAPPAHAAGTLSGAATVTPNSGNSATAFALGLPAGAACPGDSANDGWRWQTYMVPASVDPSTLTFDANGPVPSGVGAAFRQPLYDTAFSPIVNQQTANATTPPGPGPIINIPSANYSAFAPGDIPAGVYNIGIACTLGPASATQMSSYWNVQKTFTVNATGGPAQVDWVRGTIPAAPVLSSPLSPGDGTLTATFTHAASDPATTLYTVTATPTGGGVPVTATSPTVAPTTVMGLTNGTSYDVTVKATNTVGDSPLSNMVQGTPNPAARPPVQNLAAVPGTGEVDLSWDAPTGPAPIGYEVVVVGGATTNLGAGTLNLQVTGLTCGTLYAFNVTPLHPDPYVGTMASIQATPFCAQVLVQDVSVVRPTGAIVLTQVCGEHGIIPADTSATPGFPADSLPEIAAAGPGTAPTGPSGPDPAFDEYPYPDNPDGTPNPTYPTNCGLDLGNAQFVRTGPGAGQFFAASGVLSQVTVVDTRDLDEGWVATGTMSEFVASGDSFSGSQLGWTPVKTSDTEAFMDSDGVTYDQVVLPGGPVVPDSLNAVGLSTGRTLGSAAPQAGSGSNFTGGLGIAELDARLKLLIPVTADSGTYVGTLTITVTGSGA